MDHFQVAMAPGRMTMNMSPPPWPKTACSIDRVCLMIPPSVFLLDERVFMTLGILKVAAMLEQAGVAVEVLDLSGISNYEEVVTHHLARGSAGCYGLTATTPQMPAASRIQRLIRTMRPEARVILGGPHVTLIHAALRHEGKRNIFGRAHRAWRQLEDMFDVLVTGDGEFAIFEALGPRPPKLVDGDNPSSPLFLSSHHLAQLPFPARHLVDVESYRYTIDGVRALSLIAQLGCPFGCGFCGGRKSPMLRRMRMREAGHVVEEMVHMYNTYGVTGFMLYDDEMNVNPNVVGLMQSITAAQRRLGVRFHLRGFVKAELFTEEQARAMSDAGFRWILVGFESGHERILTTIQKQASRDENTRCMEIATRHGLKVKALMSIGHPGESPETVQATQDWLLAVQPDDFDATVITTYPGTPYFDDAIETAPGVWTYTSPKNGDRLHSIEIDYRETVEYYKGMPGQYRSYVYTDHLTSDDLVRLRDGLETEVRSRLNIPFNQSAPSMQFEHSMGQGDIPASILRASSGTPAARAEAG
ncbi:MAG: B12-binding domain-containing radical SAM protein [Nitrospira sp.]|nr:B12-binding domain-containing radical SAM protein [Nitrospira sp.]